MWEKINDRNIQISVFGQVLGILGHCMTCPCDILLNKCLFIISGRERIQDFLCFSFEARGNHLSATPVF